MHSLMGGAPLGALFGALAYVVAAVYCFVLPGYALYLPLRPRRSLSWLEQLAVAAALSISIYPLLYLWSYTAGLAVGPLIAWLPGAIGLAVWLWVHRGLLRPARPTIAQLRTARFDIALVLLLLGLIVCRLLPVRGMVAPAWGDSVHHTMIVQLLLDNGGLFQSWTPYAPLATFTYHFGFHTNMAVWATVTGQTVPQAIITGGQMFNVMAVLALYPLALRLGGSRMAGLGALIVAGLVSQQPGMYVNWGRYTQLAAQIILPVWLWALDVWWTEHRRPPSRLLGMVAVLAAGIALTHYRVAIVALLAAIAWGLWALWLLRRQWRDWLQRAAWLAGAGVVAVALVLPWAFVVRASRLADVAGALAQRSTASAAVRGELTIWNDINVYYSGYLWAGAVAAVILALWRRRGLAVPLMLWTVLVFVAANPFLVGVGGTGIVTNFLLALGLYIPLALIAGWLLAEVWQLARAKPYGQLAYAAALLLIALFGMRSQLAVVDPFYQMVTLADVDALNWADENSPPDSRFLVNAFLAYNDSLVAGSDAGWWLPYYTRRASNVPPILYGMEALSPDIDRDDLRQLVLDVQASHGEADALRAPLCRSDITHVFLGDRQGQVGFGDTQLIHAAWLQENPDFRLLYQAGDAQIWLFDRSPCLQPQ